MGFLRIAHVLSQELHQLSRTARKLRHLLHNIEGSRCGVNSRWIGHFHRLGLLNGWSLFYNYDFINCASVNLGIRLALLDDLLLLWPVIDVICYGTGIEGESCADDGHKGEQLQQVAATGFLICHHVNTIFEGTVTNAISNGVPADACGLRD